jgi:hypothetical protein
MPTKQLRPTRHNYSLGSSMRISESRRATKLEFSSRFYKIAGSIPLQKGASGDGQTYPK